MLPGQYVKYKNDRDCTYTVDFAKRLHSYNDAPAVVMYQNGVKCSEIWYNHGEIHRDNGKPARLEYYPSGEVMDSYWYKHGKIHRDNDLPAIENYWDKSKSFIGQSSMLYWYKDDKLHRDNGMPALLHYIFVDKDTYLVHNYWYTESKLYRDPSKGPAFITQVVGLQE